MKYIRAQSSILIDRLNEKPTTIIIVSGPRQVGKTTLVKQTLAKQDLPYQYITTEEHTRDNNAFYPEFESLGHDDESIPLWGDDTIKDRRWLASEWQKARNLSKKHGDGFVLVIDEIQKIENWSETVKGLWDRDKWDDQQFHVILLSSAPLLMQQGLSDSLAGRFEPIKLLHWSFTEMYEAFDLDLDRFIFFGGYPGAVEYINEHERWARYINEALIEPNIEKDILKMQRVDKPALMKKLFYLGSYYSGQILSYNKMLGQLHDAGNTTTLARYLELLSKADLLTGLENFSPKPVIRRSSSPKLNVNNTALISACYDYSFTSAKADRSHWGRLVESAVGAHILNTEKYNKKLFYWRRKNFEVDFVIEKGSELVAIEVKSGQHNRNSNGLTKFNEQFQPKRSLLVGEGGIPLSEFFSTPAEELLEIE